MRVSKIYRKIARLGDVDLFYMDTKTDGQPIICLHGRWGRAETWSDFIHHYGDKYRVIAPDQRGHGLSSKPLSKYTSEEMAEDIIKLLNFLKIDSAIIVGHSMGGSVAAYIAALYPQYAKALVILDQSPVGHASKKEYPKDIDELSELRDDLTKNWPMPFKTLQDAMEFIRDFSDSELGYQYFMNSLVETVDGYKMMFSSQAMAANSLYREGWFHILDKIECLTMLVKSSSDKIVKNEDFEKMKSLISNCISYQVSSPDHNVQLSNKDEFYGCFDEFLKKIEGNH